MIRPLILSASLAALATPSFTLARELASPSARVTAANRAALREPSSTGYLNAVQIYPYAEGMLYRLYAAPERVTDILLEPGERIISVAAGDTVRWTVGDTTSGSGEAQRTHVLVKPFAAGLRTNLVITTDRRAYHLQLESTPSTAMAAISWTYPGDALLALNPVAAGTPVSRARGPSLVVERLNFNYTISGSTPPWRPVRAFDDGRQTYIEFPPAMTVGEAPPLFVLGEGGKSELVNYRVAGRYYVVDRLFAAAELRLGAKRQKVVRITSSQSGQRMGNGS